MGVAMSIVMIAVGAILRFAVSVTTTGINLHTIGSILIHPRHHQPADLDHVLELPGGFGAGAGGGYRRQRRVKHTTAQVDSLKKNAPAPPPDVAPATTDRRCDEAPIRRASPQSLGRRHERERDRVVGATGGTLALTAETRPAAFRVRS